MQGPSAISAPREETPFHRFTDGATFRRERRTLKTSRLRFSFLPDSSVSLICQPRLSHKAAATAAAACVFCSPAPPASLSYQARYRFLTRQPPQTFERARPGSLTDSPHIFVFFPPTRLRPIDRPIRACAHRNTNTYTCTHTETYWVCL